MQSAFCAAKYDKKLCYNVACWPDIESGNWNGNVLYIYKYLAYETSDNGF